MALLSGLRVLDLTAAAAGPFATQMLADMGAEVIKVEPPGGERGRQWGTWHDGDYSFLFLAGNTNKRSVVLDLTAPDPPARIAYLASSADIVMSSFAPPRARQFGLDYESLRAINDRLIYVSITGYGLTGPGSGDYFDPAQWGPEVNGRDVD
jgi:formyl-CoA transferase